MKNGSIYEFVRVLQSRLAIRYTLFAMKAGAPSSAIMPTILFYALVFFILSLFYPTAQELIHVR
jgi:hypothetical protein